jgi:hypothetical protein
VREGADEQTILEALREAHGGWIGGDVEQPKSWFRKTIMARCNLDYRECFEQGRIGTRSKSVPPIPPQHPATPPSSHPEQSERVHPREQPAPAPAPSAQAPEPGDREEQHQAPARETDPFLQLQPKVNDLARAGILGDDDLGALYQARQARDMDRFRDILTTRALIGAQAGGVLPDVAGRDRRS